MDKKGLSKNDLPKTMNDVKLLISTSEEKIIPARVNDFCVVFWVITVLQHDLNSILNYYIHTVWTLITHDDYFKT